jgi:hypothetical protein
MRLTLVSLLALTLTPIASFAYSDKTPVEAYQETIQKLNVEYEKLKQLTADAKQKVAELENDANRIEALIAKYEAALGTTTLEKVAKLTDAISVSSDGNVGIGTKNPRSPLHITDDGGTYVTLMVKSSTNHGGVAVDVPSGRQAHYIFMKNGVVKWQWRTPQYADDLRAYSGTLGDDVLILKNTGNVGIGTGNPQYKLDVKGQMRADNVTVKSDQRHKQNIHSLKNALTKLQGLRGVSFKWKDNTQNADTQIGLIAQEVEKVLPELVSTDSDGYKSIAYGKLTAVLVEALKEQQLQIERLENLIQNNNQK